MAFMIFEALIETLVMVGFSMLIGLLGIPLGIYLYKVSSNGLSPSSFWYSLTSGLINILRSIPYIILMILLIPMTRFIVGTSIGTMASVIPLGITAFLLTARSTEDALSTVLKEQIDIGLALGASDDQILWRIIFVEATPHLIKGLTAITVNTIGFSAMAGAVGGGGLGDFAIRYGYQRYDPFMMIIVVIILIALVQIVQSVGNWLSQRMDRQ